MEKSLFEQYTKKSFGAFYSIEQNLLIDLFLSENNWRSRRSSQWILI